MPKIVPVKNIDPVLVDVRKPKFDYRKFRRETKLNLSRVPAPPFYSRRKGFLFRLMAALVVFVFVGGGLFLFASLKNTKDTLAAKSDKIISDFSRSIEALRNLKPAEANEPLKESYEELSGINQLLSRGQNRLLFNLTGGLWPTLKTAGSLFGDITKLNTGFLKLSALLADLQVNGFNYFQTDGKMLLQNLNDLENTLQEIAATSEMVKNKTNNLKAVSASFGRFDEVLSEQYLKQSAELYQWINFVGALKKILESDSPKHLALFFQNPAEIRPGGGFIGSYADLIVKNGQLLKIDVRDIYDPDGQLDLKVIPPEPLQSITKDWGARDANWFFDFPTSAETVLEFLEASKMYAEAGVKFEGAIALNINLLESALDIIGPVELKEYNLVIDKNNFWIEIQREVEAGREKREGGYPKKILQILAPTILEKLKNLGDSERQKFFDKLVEHFAAKDIMIFMRDRDLAAFLRIYNADGAVYELPNNFWGTYLAVVSANIAGGKSDAFVDEKIELKIDIDTDGGIFNDLLVTRAHRGDKERDPWWRATNKNFIKIFTNPQASLFGLKGNDFKATSSRAGYDKYLRDPRVETVEATKVFLSGYNAWSMQEAGKKVFATWFNVPAGQTKELNLRYQIPAANQGLVYSGKVFRFIFEKQSGVKSPLKIKISAPLGYQWAESKSPIYSYENQNPEKRVILDLTLTKTD